MAIPFRSPIDLGKLEIQNAVVQQLGSDPGTPVTGQLWYRSDTHTLHIRGNAETLRLNNLTTSEFNTAVQLNRLDQLAAPTASVSMNSQLITNVLAPVSSTDAANKAYVDSLAAGLDPKESVRVATTAAGTLATDFENGDTIDGVVLATGNRILIKDQADNTENGIYVVAASGAPTRAADANTGAELTGGTFVFVEAGTTNDNSGWVASHAGTPTLGSSAITFVQFSSAGSITAGNGLTQSGNTIDVVGTTDRILVNANDIDISPNYVGQASIVTLGTVTTGTWSATTIAVNKGGTGAVTAADARANLGLGASDSPQFTGIELGHATDTTITRTGSGDIAIEGNAVYRAGGTDVPVTDGGTGSSTAAGARSNLGATGKYSALIGDGTTNPIVVTQGTHGLASDASMHADIYEVSSGDKVEVDTRINNANGTVTITFAVVATTNQYRLVLIG